MKTQTIKKLGFTLLLSSAMLVSFARGNHQHNNANNEGDCITSISGLTQNQVSQINALEDAHQEKMDALRTERRSTSDNDEKVTIRARMIEQRDAHRDAVMQLMNDEQKEVYAQLHETGKQKYQNPNKGNEKGNRNSGKQGNRGNNASNGKGNRSNGNGNGSGNGSGHGNGNNSHNCRS